MEPGKIPGKFADLSELIGQEEEGASRGQILVLFSLFLMGLIGILGLATDVGYTMAAKRAVQGAADAGAINGARMIARYTDAAPTSSGSEMEAALLENKFGKYTPFALDCDYIGANWAVVGDCHSRVPSNAVGSRLQTKMNIRTFFMQIFPGISGDVSVTGYAKARVEVAVNAPFNAPLMICGTSAWDVSSNPTTTAPASASHTDIVSGSSIRQAAIGKTFRVVDPELYQAGSADCNARTEKFSGIADTSRNNGKRAGARFGYSTSNVLNATPARLDGPDGCKAGVAAPYNCVMLIPIAAPGETTTGNDLKVVAFAAFSVTSIGGGRFNATLLDDYIISGKGDNVWNRQLGGVVVVRLIW
jgi:hypothetical protein